MTIRIAGLAGSLGTPSEIRALVDLAVRNAAYRFGGVRATCDLGDFQPSLGHAASAADLDPQAGRFLDTLLVADVLVVSSPVYRGQLFRPVETSD